ncbi:MAG: VacJ family lipoprotein [Alphaproteobacteria bacterium]|nr:VacJ family lipoprotein [Alphaproteobacteria bacterium]
MTGDSRRAAVAWLMAGVAAIALAHGAAADDAVVADPAESANRAVFGTNNYLDRHVMRPMVDGYRETTPTVLQKGVSNFLSNLKEPSVALNDLLQGNVARSWSTVWRFAVNSTAGGLGVYDMASTMGLDRHEADFGQTLGVWGVGNGPYMTLPLLGPSTARDAAGTVVGFVLNPLQLGPAQPAVAAGQALDQRVQAQDSLQAMERASIDYYASLRSAYVQHRQAVVADGKTPGSLLFPAAPVAPAIQVDEAPPVEADPPATLPPVDGD